MFEVKGKFSDLTLEESLVIDGGGFYEIFMRGCELVFVGTCTAVGAAAGNVLGAAAGALVGEVIWEAAFGNSLAGNLLRG